MAENYRVSGSIGLTAALMLPTTVYLDTCSGVNVINRKFVPTEWLSQLKPVLKDPRLGDANSNPIVFDGMLTLTLRFANRAYRVAFYVARHFAVDVLVGTAFHNRYIKGIFPIDQRVTFENDESVPMLQSKNNAPGVAPSEEGAPNASPNRGEAPQSHTVRVARRTMIPPQSQISVHVKSQAAGLSYLSPKASLLFRHNVRVANGIAELTPGQNFEVIIANFGTKPVQLHKGMVVGYANRHPLAIISPEHDVAQKVLKLLNLQTLASNREQNGTATSNEGNTEDDETRQGEHNDWERTLDLAHIEDEGLQRKIKQVLRKHSTMWDGTLGTIKVTEHRIEVEPGTKPIRSLPYRQGPATRKMTHEQIQEQLEAGVIEPCTTEWASPVVFAPKKDGTMRFCVDYRRLNLKTLSDAYPLPRMDDCIDSLGDSAVFSTLDCNSGYWQIPMADEDKDKTAFVTHLGTFRYKRMPFGLKNAPATFQRALDIILSGVRWQSCLIYLDDVIVFSKDAESHLEHLDEILTLLRKAGVTLKLRKCSFFQDRVNYLGHVVSPGKLAVASENRDAIHEAEFPRDMTQLRSFLGACNVFRRFVKGFAKIAGPLNNMLRKDVDPDFDNPTDEQLTAFEALKKALVEPPVLALPRVSKPYVIETDASNYQIGCALLQEQDDGHFHPVGYWSRTLTKAERNYSPTEKECLAVVWSITSLRPYIEGTRFTVRSDHDSLRWLMNLTESSGRLTRWRLRLAEFDFVIEYKPGRQNQVADALSRLVRPNGEKGAVDDAVPCFVSPKTTILMVTTRSGPKAKQRKKARRSKRRQDQDEEEDTTYTILQDEEDNDDFDKLEPDDEDQARAARYDHEMAQAAESRNLDTLPQPITVEEIVQEQKLDSFCQTTLARMNRKRRSSFYEDEHGVLRRKCPYDGQVQIVLPETLRPRVLHLTHHSLLAGHPGQTRLYNTLRRTYYWPHMAADVFATVRNCGRCAKNRILLRKRTNYLRLFPATRPLESVAIDVLGPLTKTKKGHRYILVMTCRFSKLTQVVPLKTITSYNIALAFCTHWVFKFGPPQHLVLDNAQNFTAKFFQSVCAHLGVALRFITTYHPQSNGQAERYNRTLAAMLRNYVNDHQDDWDQYAEALTYAYNNHIHRSVGTTPFDLVLTRPPPDFSLHHAVNPRERPTAGRKADFVNRLDEAINRAYASLIRTQARYKADYDKTIRKANHNIRAGDWIYLDNPERTPGKLETHAQGPFEVLASDGHTFTIQRDGITERVSSDRLTAAPRPTHEQPNAATEHTPTLPRGVELSDERYVVDKILGDSYDEDNNRWFLVKYYGYDGATLEPEAALPSELVSRFDRREHDK